VQISQNLVIRTFFQYCKRPIFKKNAGTYTSECPYCHEGASAGKKRRFFYIPEEGFAYCHNCNTSKSGIDFVKDVSGMTIPEILAESEQHTESVEDLIKKSVTYKKYNPKSLPDDSINLFDINQVSFYKENSVVKDALEFISKRRLDTAVNKPRALWLSLTDYTHKNRVVFPFYVIDGSPKIDFYQTRALYKEDEERAKYLSKTNSDKGIFNIDRVTPEIEYIFLQEGPIDAMFLRNSVALAGIKPTEVQLESITNSFPMHKVAYILDNQWVDKTSYKVTKELLDRGHTVFIWPKGLERFKDLNDLCVHLKKDEIKPEFVIKHLYTGMKGLLQFSQIKNAN
jgi:hypothetical protein